MTHPPALHGLQRTGSSWLLCQFRYKVFMLQLPENPSAPPSFSCRQAPITCVFIHRVVTELQLTTPPRTYSTCLPYSSLSLPSSPYPWRSHSNSVPLASLCASAIAMREQQTRPLHARDPGANWQGTSASDTKQKISITEETVMYFIHMNICDV